MVTGDNAERLLDDGYWLIMYHNGQGSIDVVALGESESDTINDIRECIDDLEDRSRITCGLTPAEALHAIAEQML